MSSGFKRSNSLKNLTTPLGGERREFQNRRSSAKSQAKVEEPKGAALLGPLPIASAGLFSCATRTSAKKPCKQKEPTSKVTLHRKINDLDRVI